MIHLSADLPEELEHQSEEEHLCADGHQQGNEQQRWYAVKQAGNAESLLKKYDKEEDDAADDEE